MSINTSAHYMPRNDFKVIFWVDRNVQGCANAQSLENFYKMRFISPSFCYLFVKCFNVKK